MHGYAMIRFPYPAGAPRLEHPPLTTTRLATSRTRCPYTPPTERLRTDMTQHKLVATTTDREAARALAGGLQDLVEPPPNALTLFEAGEDGLRI